MKGLRRWWPALLLTSTCYGVAAPGPLMRDYRHTSWTAADGLPSQISAMAQTRDGWLWIGTEDGLYRFDGLHFAHVAPPARGVLARSRIFSLHAADNGDLWVGYFYGGLAVMHPDGRIEDIPDSPDHPVGAVASMAVDGAGTLWILALNGLYQITGTPGHYRLRLEEDGTAWQKVEPRSLHTDQYGDVWASYDGRIVRKDAASSHFVNAAPPEAHGSLVQSPDGRLWTQLHERLIAIGPGPGHPAMPRPLASNQRESSWSGQFDRDGNLWKIRCPDGLCVLPAAGTAATALDPAGLGERVVDPADLSNRDAQQVLEDREGNVWVVTAAGLDRYQPNRLLQSGLPGTGTTISLAADADGGVWAADTQTYRLWRLAPGQAPVLQPDQEVRVVGTARDGALLLSGKRAITRRLHGVDTPIPLPPGRDGKPVDLHVLGTLDDGKVLWMASIETGLMGYADGAWRPRSAFNLPGKIVISGAGGIGQLWLADGDGGLTLYDDGKLTRYDATVAGIANAVSGGPDVLVAGERGLAVLQHGAMRLLNSAQPDSLRNISGITITPDGDRWFNGLRGVVHVRAADWADAMAHPEILLRSELLDARDGYPGQGATAMRLPSAVQAAGTLWLATTGGVVRLDTRSVRRNTVAPVPQILQVATSQASYPAQAQGVTLPPASQAFSVAFTAPAMRRAENVRYAYRLDGIDTAWVDGGTRQAANYTQMPPGTYRFHVRATNEDGVMGAQEAVQTIHIAPTIPQTTWFRLLMLAGAVLMGVALYRYRIRRLTARLMEQMQVRMHERERIARTLHDTYLQSVHALLLRVGAMAQSLPVDHPTRSGLEHVLQDASKAVVEGRGQVEQLRSHPGLPDGAGEHALENLLESTAAPLRQCYPDVAYTLQVDGTRRPLAPEVVHEAGQIAAEALRNAFIHGGAAHIDVMIGYRDPFTVVVRDDGKGIEEEVRRVGYRSGHWGLLGMRERARAIDAAMTIDSGDATGTTVTLAVPGAWAYPPERPRRRWLRWR